MEATNYLGRSVHPGDIETVVEKLPYSDWLILYFLAQAMDKDYFGDLLAKLSVILTSEQQGDDSSSVESGNSEVKTLLPPDATMANGMHGNNKNYGRNLSNGHHRIGGAYEPQYTDNGIITQRNV